MDEIDRVIEQIERIVDNAIPPRRQLLEALERLSFRWSEELEELEGEDSDDGFGVLTGMDDDA